MGSRYYDTKNPDEEIRPGRISDELRAALDMADNDLPLWIYRMRALGYPPGWLAKATVDTNDIFQDDDDDDDNDGDHERDETEGKPNSKKRKKPLEEVQYDLSKLIEYPGFNAPLPPNTTDYHYYYNMPPMLPHQQLEYAKQHMNAFRPAPLPKRVRTSNSHNQSTSKSTNGEDESPASPEVESKSNMSSSLTEEIKLVSKGSPMPKPVNRMPLEKFSEGVVGDLLYFENTPNSSGKFDSIRDLLNTIRRDSKASLDTSKEDAD